MNLRIYFCFYMKMLHALLPRVFLSAVLGRLTSSISPALETKVSSEVVYKIVLSRRLQPKCDQAAPVEK